MKNFLLKKFSNFSAKTLLFQERCDRLTKLARLAFGRLHGLI